MKDPSTHIHRVFNWPCLCAYFLLAFFIVLGLYAGLNWQFQSSATSVLGQSVQPPLDLRGGAWLFAFAFLAMFVGAVTLHHVFAGRALRRLTDAIEHEQRQETAGQAPSPPSDERRAVLSDVHDLPANEILPQVSSEDRQSELGQDVDPQTAPLTPILEVSTCEQMPPPAETGSASAALNILLVEDNRVNQQVALSMLKKWGHHIDVAWNGLEALEAIKRQAYDLVLMDIQMPEMDGLTATKHIRQLGGSCASVPIVAVTANAMQGDRERFLAAGMSDYIAKPIDRDTFHTVVHRYGPQARTAPADIPEALTEAEPGAPVLGYEVLSYLLNELSGETVSELIDEYMTHSSTLLSQALVASEEKDPKNVEYAVHTLKGMSGALGAIRMVDICQHILETCRNQDTQQIEDHLSGLSGATEETQQALQAWRSEHEES